MRTRNLLAAILLCSAGQTAFAENIYVDASAPPSGDGSSWKSAFNDLQNALASAKPGDEIRIAQGTYKPAPPNGLREATFNLIDGVTIQGGYAGLAGDDPDALDWQQFETILSGDLNGDDGPVMTFATMADNSYHVLTASGLGESTILRGVTITRGNANQCVSMYCTDPHAVGGGLNMNASNMRVEDCAFTFNRVTHAGGAMYILGGSPVVLRCRFQQNRAYYGYETYGGAVANGGNPTFVECQFIDNYSSWYSGAVNAGYSGATFRSCTFQGNFGSEGVGALSGYNLAIVDCTFDQNIGGHGNGAVNCLNSLIVNCKFTRNQAGMNLYPGAALRSWGGSTVVNSTFAGNYGSSTTVAMYGNNSISNCTVVGNWSDYDFAAVRVFSGQLVLANSIVWDNYTQSPAPSAAVIVNGPSTVQNCCIEGWTGAGGGQGNHGNDPRFVDAAGPDGIYGTEDDNLRLRPNSPCIEAGDSGALPADETDLDDDGDTTEWIPFDLDWLPRIVNRVVDLGAYEFQGAPCRADINGDGTVTVDDLLVLISAWGACPMGQSCDADLNLDGSVNTDDLAVLLSGWGACP